MKDPFQEGHTFNKHGYSFRILWREKNVVLASQAKSYSDNRLPPPIAYEVAVLQTYEEPDTLPNGKSIPANTVRYPKSSEWGTYGWTFTCKDDAITRFRAETTRTRKRKRSHRGARKNRSQKVQSVATAKPRKRAA